MYHALHSYFDRDNVALPNIAKYFNEQVRAARRRKPAWRPAACALYRRPWYQGVEGEYKVR